MKIPMRTISITAINHVELGKLLRKQRNDKNISLRALAKKMRFTAPYLSDLEKGRRNWSQKLIDGYFKHLKIKRHV